jgi:hypothetical protein
LPIGDLMAARGRTGLIDGQNLRASGTFQFHDVTYEVTFTTVQGLTRCIDIMFGYGEKSFVVRLYLKSINADWPSANMRFDYDLEHQVAAGSLTALDVSEILYGWETVGNAGRDDIFLTGDSWNPDERRYSPSAFVPPPAMRQAVAEFTFGEELPPLAMTMYAHTISEVRDGAMGWPLAAWSPGDADLVRIELGPPVDPFQRLHQAMRVGGQLTGG